MTSIFHALRPSVGLRVRRGVLTLATASLLLHACAARTATDRREPLEGPAVDPQVSSPTNADMRCGIKALKRAEAGGIVVHSPDGSRYLVNKEDAKGIAQIYIGTTGQSGLTCLSCT